MAQETIEVRANQIGNIPGAGDYYHLFIVYTNSQGDEFYLRGGPSGEGPGSSRLTGELGGGSSANPSGSSGGSNGSSNSGRSGDSSLGRPYGNIVTDYGPYTPGTIDWNPAAESVVVARGSDLSGVYRQLQREMDAIEAAGIRYNPLGPNSNSTVTTALDNVGIEPRLPQGVWAPGSDMQQIVPPANRRSEIEQGSPMAPTGDVLIDSQLNATSVEDRLAQMERLYSQMSGQAQEEPQRVTAAAQVEY